jgi:hypothetical protein
MSLEGRPWPPELDLFSFIHNLHLSDDWLGFSSLHVIKGYFYKMLIPSSWVVYYTCAAFLRPESQ